MGLTQTQLAERARMSIGALQDLEQGRVGGPHPQSARRLAQVLGMGSSEWASFSVSYRHRIGRDRVAGDGRVDAAIREDQLPSGAAGSGLWVGLLGSFAARRDGRELAAFPAGQCVVLGLLALAGGSPVWLQSLIDALWGEAPPARAASIVHTYVSRLRRALEPDQRTGGTHLPGACRGGYRFVATAAELDLLAWRRLVQDARSAHAAADPEEACRAYEAALGLWRGEPLADVEVLREHPAVVALADEQAAVVLEYADVASATGRHGQVLPHLRALTGREPLDEAGHARLMIALAGSGRQGEALSLYERLRRRLDTELGVPPSYELRGAHARVLSQDIPVRAVPR